MAQSRHWRASSSAVSSRSAGSRPAHPPRRARRAARSRHLRAPPPCARGPPALVPAASAASLVPSSAASGASAETPRRSSSSSSLVSRWSPRTHAGHRHSPSGTRSSGGSRHAQWYSESHSSQSRTTPALTSPPHTAHPSSHATFGSFAGSGPNSVYCRPSTISAPVSLLASPLGPFLSAAAAWIFFETLCAHARSGAPASLTSCPQRVAAAASASAAPTVSSATAYTPAAHRASIVS